MKRESSLLEIAKYVPIAAVVAFGLIYFLGTQLPAPQEDHAPLSEAHPWTEQWTRPATTEPAPMMAPHMESPQGTAGVTAHFDALRAACVAEARRTGDVTGAPTGACRKYEQAVAQRGDPTVNVVSPSHGAPQTSGNAPGSSRAQATIVAHECGFHTYGSIPYRQCRAAEKKSLLRQCTRGKELAEQTSGERRQLAKEIAAENCRVADLYRIVN